MRVIETTPLATGFAVLALATVASGAPDTGPTTRAKDAQIIRGDVFEDIDYAFTVKRPSPQWTFLKEQKAKRHAPDTVMVLVNPARKGIVVVVVEKLGDMAISDYADMVLQASRQTRPVRELTRRRVTVDGRPGIVLLLQMTIEGVTFQYRNLLVRHGKYYYQVMGGGLVSYYKALEPDLTAIAGSLRFAKDRQPRDRVASGIKDDFGADWRIVGDVYGNASHGFRLRPGHGLRLAGRDGLKQMGKDAVAGLLGLSPTFYQVYIVERVGRNPPPAMIQQILLNVEQELNLLGRDVKKSTVRIAGVEAQQRLYRKARLHGAAFDVVQTYFFRGPVLFRIQSWWPSAEGSKANERLRQSYRMLEWLTEPERARLQGELARMDATNAIGADFCLRGRVFRDFRFGYSLTLPEGLWHASTGDDARAVNPIARFAAQLSAEGVFLVVIPETVEMPHEQYHRVLRETMMVPASIPTRTRRYGGLKVRESAFDRTEGRMVFSYRLGTVVRGRKHVQILAWALKANADNLARQFPRVLQGLEVPESSPPALERRAGRIRDRRLGFQLTYPDGWTAKAVSLENVGAWGNMIGVKRGAVFYVGGAVWVPMGGADEELVIMGILKGSGLDIDPASRREEPSTLAGRPARQLYFESQKNGIPLSTAFWVTKRGNTLYIFSVSSARGQVPTPDRYKSFFTLTD